jgi:hypothetical protein
MFLDSAACLVSHRGVLSSFVKVHTAVLVVVTSAKTCASPQNFSRRSLALFQPSKYHPSFEAGIATQPSKSFYVSARDRTTSIMASKPSLLDLPAELRLNILEKLLRPYDSKSYLYCCNQHCGRPRRKYGSPRTEEDFADESRTNTAKLATTCQLLAAEVEEVLYSRLCFNFCISDPDDDTGANARTRRPIDMHAADVSTSICTGAIMSTITLPAYFSSRKRCAKSVLSSIYRHKNHPPSSPH